MCSISSGSRPLREIRGRISIYTIARINSILKKYEAVCGTPKDPVILPPEAEPEKTLMLALSRFSEVMEAGFEELAPP